MSTKTPECWATDPNAHALKIDLSIDHSLLLPFDQFAFAELKSEAKDQSLRMVFATHEILLRGHALRRLEAALQRNELSWVSVFPEQFSSTLAANQPRILAIAVKESASGSGTLTENQE